MLLNHAQIAALIPHSGRMCLLDGVEHWDETSILCITRSHLQAGHPLWNKTGLSAVHAVEYGAQAAAVHGGLLAQAQGAQALPGYIVQIKELELSCARLDTIQDAFSVSAQRLAASAQGWIYQFSLSTQLQEWARGRVSIAIAPQ